MDDPILDSISAAILVGLRNNTRLYDLFQNSPFMDILRGPFRHLSGWKLIAAQRMVVQKVATERVFEVLKEMEASGQFPECKDKDDPLIPINGMMESSVGGEPAAWDGNIYATYGGIKRNGTIE